MKRAANAGKSRLVHSGRNRLSFTLNRRTMHSSFAFSSRRVMYRATSLSRRYAKSFPNWKEALPKCLEHPEGTQRRILPQLNPRIGNQSGKMGAGSGLAPDLHFQSALGKLKFYEEI